MVDERGTNRSTGQLGFTLLEVLVAFAIAAPALAVLFSTGVGAVGAVKTSVLYQEAISRAKSRLDSVSGGGLVAGEQYGEEGGGFKWRTRIVPLATIAVRRHAPDEADRPGATLYAVMVELSWSAGVRPRSVSLGSRRIGPAVASLP